MKRVNVSVRLSMMLMAASISITMFSCGDDDEEIKAPIIASFTPTSALPGASVTISGNNFSATASNNHVSFNGMEAAVTSATATQLVVTVPQTATTGKITVTINGKTATSSADFTVLQTTFTGFSRASRALR